MAIYLPSTLTPNERRNARRWACKRATLGMQLEETHELVHQGLATPDTVDALIAQCDTVEAKLDTLGVRSPELWCPVHDTYHYID